MTLVCSEAGKLPQHVITLCIIATNIATIDIIMATLATTILCPPTFLRNALAMAGRNENLRS